MLRSESGRRSARRMPLDRILPETDGPFGGTSGKLLYPWSAIDVSAELAEVMHVSPAEIEARFIANLTTLAAVSGDRKAPQLHYL
jgi:TatD DNase family protein